jgi:type VI secretion system secreted protein VgrG
MNSAPVINAQSDALAAYNCYTSTTCNTSLTGQNLGGLTLTPDVYCYATSAQLTGTLILDGLNQVSPQWVFQIGSTLTTAASSSVVFVNYSGNATAATWLIGSSATFGTSTVFKGDVIAFTSITMTTSASNQGSLIALNGAVTLDTNNVVSFC